jgi:hypothetical protein
MDVFDRFWQWAEKPLDSRLTTPLISIRQKSGLAMRTEGIAKCSTNPPRIPGHRRYRAVRLRRLGTGELRRRF